ncbi:MAG: adenylate/guanylate cyclase domain-containing protein [Gammaproteobacteria bacterium]|nr:adenylate/guanylate cyclase domain-containing protein [Gammaproteobacteria bacterium]
MSATDFTPAPVVSGAATGLGRAQRVRRFVTVSSALMVGLSGLWAIYALSMPHYAQFAGNAALTLIGAIALIMLRTRGVALAIRWLLIMFPVWVVTMAWFISGSGLEHYGAVHYWLIVYIVALHFVLFDTARIVQTFYVAAAILVFIVIEYNLVPLNPIYGYPESELVFGHGLTLGLVLIAVALIMRNHIAGLADAERRAREAGQLSDQLLLSVLPRSIITRMRSEGMTFAERADNCTVLFADIVGFTRLASSMPAAELVALLNDVFGRFDALTERHGVEKIKTIGDGYLAVCGLPDPCADHARRVALLAIDMLEAIDDFDALSVRIGIHSGPVLAGVIGRRRFAFDLWGDTVNLAARMESHGSAGRIQVSEVAHALLVDNFRFEPPHTIDVKGKGPTTAYFLSPARPGPSS